MGCSPHAGVEMNFHCQRKPEPDALVNLLFHAQYWHLAPYLSWCSRPFLSGSIAHEHSTDGIASEPGGVAIVELLHEMLPEMDNR